MAVKNAEVEAGSSLAILGAGPVGLMAAECARMLGADPIYIVDHHPYRLEFAAAAYGAIPINFDEVEDPAEEIIRRTDRRGVDAAIDAVGFEAKGSLTETVLTNLRLEGSSGSALRQAIAMVRRGGIVSVPGVYAGFIHGFLFGDAFEKGLTFRMGQTHVQGLLPELIGHLANGSLQPERIITHRLPLSEAARGYEIFDGKQENCRKVVLRPG
jgi:threonine dehydrogenase-like Zn-dependent dehydrogenase